MIRVLHVDDEAPIRMLSRVNLAAEGMEVIEAENGRIGVQRAKREQPDLILLGVMMPGLDGWQVAEELREDPETREIPIVFLTARAELRDCARGFDLGAVDYILKPFDPTELAPRIRGLLERLERGERDELRREKFWEVRALIVDDLVARATSRADFMRFLDALRADLKVEFAHPEAEVAWGAGEWSHADLDGFLGALEAWLRASPSGQFDALAGKAWQGFAEVLLAARVYE